jgi:hydroxymethylglutaryl-CoA lyase
MLNRTSRRLYFNEVAPRDGFQIEPAFIPTEAKIRFVDALSQCGLAKVEVSSFTSPKAIPALADAEAVMAGIQRVPGVVYTVLVPNQRGAVRALGAKADELNLVMSASETHNLLNLRMTREQSFAQLAEIIQSTGTAARIQISLSCSFGCPMEGEVPAAGVLALAQRFADLGAQGITLCDTTGMAQPLQVQDLCQAFGQRLPAIPLTLHVHNTRGMGLVNALAAAEAGVSSFDASLGGLGGCPYAPGATGNVCTEDLVHMFAAMGHDTGIDLARLLAVAGTLADLVGHAVPGQVLRAGPSSRLHPVPEGFPAIRAKAMQDSQLPIS